MSQQKITPLQKYEHAALIDEGGHGQIYRISDEHVVKVPKISLDDIEKEARIGSALFSRGISVPEQFGIQDIRLSWGVREGLVMRYVEGDCFQSLPEDSPERRIAAQKHDDEMRKAAELGYSPRCLDFPNNIWDGTDIYLIDFVDWEEPPR